MQILNVIFTALFLGEEFDNYYENPETCEQNIKDGVKPAFTGAPKPIEAVACKSSPRNPNLYLLAGHMNLSEYEANLTFAFYCVTSYDDITKSSRLFQ